MADQRIVVGARCTWWDSIDKVGSRGVIPCCPHCGGVLFEYKDQTAWDEGVAKYDADHPGYKEMMDWARGKCFANLLDLTRAYEAREVTGQ